MRRVGIIGAGIAGLACAEGLSGSSADVVLIDKGRHPGGRMSTRRLTTALGDAEFDYGAQYFTVRDPAFRARVDVWAAAGVVAPWPSAGGEAYVGVPGMNAPVGQMAAGQNVHWASTVTRVESDAGRWRVHTDTLDPMDLDILVVAIPSEQTCALLKATAPDLATAARATPSEPCWTLMLAFASPVPVEPDCWRGDDIIGWAARNSSKPGRAGPESWVIQATPQWSRDHLEADPQEIAAALKTALATLLECQLPAVVAERSHRWRYARSGASGAGAIFDAEVRLGLCGDWLIGPRVEAAWLSGTTLARTISGLLID